MAQHVEPHPFEALVLVRNSPPRQGVELTKGLSSVPLASQGRCFQLLVCAVGKGSIPRFLKLWSRSRELFS